MGIYIGAVLVNLGTFFVNPSQKSQIDGFLANALQAGLKIVC